MNEFALFRRFKDKAQADELAEELINNGIEYELIDDSPTMDITFTGNAHYQSEIQLMIKQSDFAKANKILDDKADELLMSITKDHYLFEFTNEELYEILTKPDEWSPLDYKLTQQILRDRGQVINDDLLRSLQEKRISELSKPEKHQTAWIIIGYILSTFGGLLGIFIGWSIWTMKKTLPDGEKLHIYSERDRRHGERIFVIGIIVLLINIWKLLSD